MKTKRLTPIFNKIIANISFLTFYKRMLMFALMQMAAGGRAIRHLLLDEPALSAAKLKAGENETIRNLGLEHFRWILAGLASPPL